MKKKFKGDKKKGTGLFSNFDKWLAKTLLPHIPKSIQTYHLTYTTILWSALIILGGYLANSNLKWLIFVSLIIFFNISQIFSTAKLEKKETPD